MDNSLLSNNDENCFLHTNETTQSKRIVWNKDTQVKAKQCKCNDKKQVNSTAMQTFLTKDTVIKLITPVCFVSVGTQTEDASFLIKSDDSNLLLPSDGTISMPVDAPIDVAHNLDKLVFNNTDLIVTSPLAIPTTTMLRTIIVSRNLKKLTRVQTKVKLFKTQWKHMKISRRLYWPTTNCLMTK